MTVYTVKATAVKHSGVLGLGIEEDRAKEEVLKTTPRSHNRVVLEKTEQEFKERILKACYGTTELSAGKFAYYFRKRNLGTKRWPHIVSVVDWGYIKSVGNAVCIMDNGDRPYIENIIAVYSTE